MPEPSKQPRRLCVFLLQLGGPERLDDIEPFLRNLFEDVLPVPAWLRPRLSRWIAKRRAPKVAPLYAAIGGGSPILANTEAQARALGAQLRTSGLDAEVFVVMRYAPPRAAVVLEEARRHWSDAHWVALPLYPQYSFATTRSSLDELTSLLTTPEQARLTVVNAYPADEGYLEALAACVREALAQVPPAFTASTHLLFSAHGLPLKLVREGDPYPEHVQETVAGVVRRLTAPLPVHISYQSRVGPARWLEPSTLATVAALGREGAKSLVVVPVSFVSEHIETLHELDIQVRDAARDAGIESYIRARTPGTRPEFIAALAGLVLRAVPRD